MALSELQKKMEGLADIILGTGEAVPPTERIALEHLSDRMARKKIPPKTLLLAEGEVADTLYFVEKGCLRLFFGQDGKDITFQFFFEGSFVASFDSMHHGKPSLFALESIEPSELLAIRADEFHALLVQVPSLRSLYEEKLVERFHAYLQLFLSRIKDTPRQRYEALLREHPHVIQRVPQHYIASYLGITPVSLSRIRNRR